MDDAGVDPSDIDLLISTSVCKHHLEPSVACAVHYGLGLPASCMNFDLGNACLGFINAMNVAAMAIESGQAATVLIVDGEGSRYTQLATLDRLRSALGDRRRRLRPVRVAHPGIGCGGDGDGWTTIEGPPIPRRHLPGGHRAPRPLRRRPRPRCAPTRRSPASDGLALAHETPSRPP